MVIRNPLANIGDTREVCLIPGSGRSPGEGNGNPLQYSCLESFIDREPGELQSMGSELDVTEQLSTHTVLGSLGSTPRAAWRGQIKRKKKKKTRFPDLLIRVK